MPTPSDFSAPQQSHDLRFFEDALADGRRPNADLGMLGEVPSGSDCGKDTRDNGDTASPRDYRQGDQAIGQ